MTEQLLCPVSFTMSFSLFEVFREDSTLFPSPSTSLTLREDLLPLIESVPLISEVSSESGMLVMLGFGETSRPGWWWWFNAVESPLLLNRDDAVAGCRDEDVLLLGPNLFGLLFVIAELRVRNGSVFRLCRSEGWWWFCKGGDEEEESLLIEDDELSRWLFGAGVWVWANDKYFTSNPCTWVLIMVVKTLYPRL